jgi:putative flippase GtrA
MDSRRTPEYTVASKSRHRSARKIRRLAFFGLASVWGFIVGVGGFLAAMSAAGNPVHPGLGASPGLIPGLLIAAAGGFVIAAAYRESKRR